MTTAKKIGMSIWAIVSLLLSVAFFNLVGGWSLPFLIVIWLIWYVELRNNQLRGWFSRPLVMLRRRRVLFLICLIVYCFLIILVWMIIDQPAVAKPITPRQQVLLLGGLWGVFFLLGFGEFPPAYQPERAERWFGPIISVTTILIIILAVEFGLRYFLAMPDGIDGTFMHQNWIRIHGFLEPRNALGYRDYPIENQPDSEKQQILVVGDSFAAGQGVADVEDIFTQQLARLLPDDQYQVNLAAFPGAHTGEEINLLNEHPLAPPDIIILSYFINDIFDAAEQNNVQISAGEFILPENPMARWLVDNTHLGNFIYWRTVYPQFLRWRGSYIEQFSVAYQNEAVWSVHAAQLQVFVDYATEHNSRLIVLVWPYLQDVEQTRPVTDQIEAFFSQQDVEVISMREELTDIDSSLLIVSPFDTHPSVYAHQLAGEALAEVISP